MDEVFKDPVQLSKEINLRDLLTSQQEFHIDIDFKKRQNFDCDFSDGEDGSDSEEIFKNMEDSISELLLSSPEYLSFTELGAKMIDCVPSGDIKMLIIEEGEGHLVPVDAIVTIHYAAYWEKASIPFDSSLTMNRGEPVNLKLGTGRVLPGLEVALTSVRGPSARLHVLLRPNAAWGPQGAPPRIKPETCLFVVHLYKYEDVNAGVRFNDLSMLEQSKFEVTIKTVTSLHAQAKALFAKKLYKKAIKNYQQSVSVLMVSQPKDEDEESEVKKLRVTSLVNLAVCYYKVNKPKYVINMCENIDRIIDIDGHCKALFYYGRAYQMLGKTDQAIEYYKKALKLEPKNVEIGKTLADLDAHAKKSAKEEKAMWQNAFTEVKEPEKKDKAFDVDSDFQNGVRTMFEDLAGREEYAKFNLPTGLTKDEVECIKHLARDFNSLIIQEDGEGKRKKVSVIRNI